MTGDKWSAWRPDAGRPGCAGSGESRVDTARTSLLHRVAQSITLRARTSPIRWSHDAGAGAAEHRASAVTEIPRSPHRELLGRLPQAPPRHRARLLGRLDAHAATRSRPRGSATSTRSSRPATSTASSGPSATCPPTRDRPRGVREARPDPHRRHRVRGAPQGQGRRWSRRRRDCDTEMAVIGPSGAKHVVILPEGYTDLDGNLTASPTLTDDEWTGLNTGMSELGRYLADKHGAVLVFHTHADSHVGTQARDRALPRWHRSRDRPAVPGHRPRRLLRRRQPQAHRATTRTASSTSTSSRSTRPSGPASARSSWASRRPSASARWSSRRWASRTWRPLLDALAALDRDLYCIVEQDMYPCDFDAPLPIAIRTQQYFKALRPRPRAGRSAEPLAPTRSADSELHPAEEHTT